VVKELRPILVTLPSACTSGCLADGIERHSGESGWKSVDRWD
jgi:hypothetical protein